MGKFISRTITIALILCSVCFVTYKFYDVSNVEDTSTKNVKQNNMLSMMLETGEDSGQYEMTTSSSWPTDGYVFNESLSKCENGSILSWDDTNKQVVFSGNITDKCYVYFDVYAPPSVADYCSSGQTLSSCIITFGNQGFDISNIYIHDSSLENGAGDNSYRYAGASADVNNYICLGSSEETCPADNLYRIIGVFGDNNHGIKDQQLVKVIKNTSYGLYKWNTTTSNDWASASLNETLNTTFKTEKLSGIENKIAEVSWRVSGYSTSAATAKTVYTAEITNATKKHTAKIGLMYASDYGYATTPDYWTTNLFNYGTAAKNKYWLLLGSVEWLLSPNSSHPVRAWYVGSSGFVDYVSDVTNTSAVRPSFYLSSSITYVSGDGTQESPIRIN